MVKCSYYVYIDIYLGLIVLFNPFASAIVATATLGIILLIYSILNLCEAIYINLKFKE